MTPWPATIIKPQTDDGYWVLADLSYSVGDVVEVDLESRAVRPYTQDEKDFETETVFLAEETEPRIPFPVEMLDL